MGLFSDIYNTVAKFFRPQEEQGDASKSVATNRLKLVLMQDRTNLTPKILEQMRGELIDLLSRYVELDKELLELNFEQEGEQVALMLSIPVIRAKDEEEIEAALKEEAEKKQKFTTQIVLYTIGVILLGTGVITFVAGNDWILELLQSIPVLQIIILFICAAASLLGGWKLEFETQKFPRLGSALIFLSTLLIGTCYIQIGQTYNWSTNTSIILSLWFVSIFPLAFLFKSKPVNWLSIILFITAFPYFYFEWKYDTAQVWTIFMPFSLFGILYTFANIPFIKEKFNDFSLSYKLTALIPLFFTLLIMIFSVQKSYHIINIHYLIVPAVIVLFNILNYCFDKNRDTLVQLETAFIIVFMCFLETMLILSGVNKAVIMTCAHLFLIFIISMGMYWGYKFEKVSLINLSNFFLLIYLLTVYCRYGWNYIDKTLFFLIGGIGLVSLGIFLEKDKNRRLNKKEEE